MNREIDYENTTPADFTVRVSHIPITDKDKSNSLANHYYRD